jgi:GxxExxY protein
MESTRPYAPYSAPDRLPAEAPPEWNQITEGIIRCAMEVHSHLGPGLLERLYEEALIYELRHNGFGVAAQRVLTFRYKDLELKGQRLDLIVNELVIVETKAVESVPEINLAQMTTYMRLTESPLGLLINFNVVRLKDGLFRRINGRAVQSRLRASLPPSSP